MAVHGKPHDFLAAQWDHELAWKIQGAAGGGALQNLAEASATVANASASWSAAVLRSSAAFDAAAQSRFVRFMESPLGFAAARRDHGPRQLLERVVLTAPRPGGLGTARPTVRFAEKGREVCAKT